MITIYSQPGCGQCQFTKKYLRKKGLTFQEKDISINDQYLEEVRELGFQSLPVVVGPNQEPFSGFQPDKLDGWVD